MAPILPALQTILEIGDDEALREAVSEAFGGAEVRIEATETLLQHTLTNPWFAPPYARVRTVGWASAIPMPLR